MTINKKNESSAHKYFAPNRVIFFESTPHSKETTPSFQEKPDEREISEIRYVRNIQEHATKKSEELNKKLHDTESKIDELKAEKDLITTIDESGTDASRKARLEKITKELTSVITDQAAIKKEAEAAQNGVSQISKFFDLFYAYPTEENWRELDSTLSEFCIKFMKEVSYQSMKAPSVDPYYFYPIPEDPDFENPKPGSTGNLP